MTLTELLQKISGLSAEEREMLRRELDDGPLSKPESAAATPETIAAMNKEHLSSNDERGLPIEDVIADPKVET